AFVVCSRQIGKRARDQGATDAVSNGIDLALAGRSFDGVDGREGPFNQIIRELFAGELGARIDPRDDEYRVALINAPLDERVLWLQIQNIEFVDPRRHDEQGAALHGRRRRLVLDKLHELILENDFSRRVRDVFAKAEGPKVAHLQT